MIAFTVPGPPQGKARARTVYNPKLKRSISYTPDNTVLYKWLCPHCGSGYEVDYDDYSYCPNCGQRIDREEE